MPAWKGSKGCPDARSFIGNENLSFVRPRSWDLENRGPTLLAFKASSMVPCASPKALLDVTLLFQRRNRRHL